jgi:hypothetical protein
MSIAVEEAAMLGKALQNLGSIPQSIQAVPIALKKTSRDTSKRIKHDLQKVRVKP